MLAHRALTPNSWAPSRFACDKSALSRQQCERLAPLKLHPARHAYWNPIHACIRVTAIALQISKPKWQRAGHTFRIRRTTCLKCLFWHLWRIGNQSQNCLCTVHSPHASFHRDGYRHIVAYYQGILTDGLCKIFRWAHLEVHIGAWTTSNYCQTSRYQAKCVIHFAWKGLNWPT